MTAEPLWRGKTPAVGDCCSCPLLDEATPDGQDIVVLSASHYDALVAIAVDAGAFFAALDADVA